MRKNGIGPTTTGATRKNTHKPSINHYQRKQVCRLKWHTIVFTVLVVILTSVIEAQSISVTNRWTRNVQNAGTFKASKIYCSLKAFLSHGIKLHWIFCAKVCKRNVVTLNGFSGTVISTELG